MRVCPKCGYVDDATWKHVKYSYYIDSCSFENFEQMFPELAKRLLTERIVTDEINAYRITKNNRWVERKALVDYGGQSFSDKCERGDIPRIKSVKDFRKCWKLGKMRNQSKLLETSE